MNTTNNMLPARTTMVIISILLVLGAFAAEKEEIVDGIRWTYLVAPSGAIITANSRWCDDKCHTEEIVKIPAKLGGHPVVRIRGDISPVVGYVPEIIIPEGIVSLGSIGLVGETSVRVSLPSTLKELRDYAFANCGLYSITLPKGLKTIGKRAFYWCRALEMSNIPDGVSYIGEYAFCGVKLKCCKIPSGITQISANAFSHTTIEVITFHPGVVEIGEKAFRGCDNLKSINWAAGLKRIGDEAFRKCYALESVELPCGVEFIGKDAFRDCEKLETVVIPNSVKHIAEGAFKGCKNLVSVTISEDYKYAVTDIFPGLDDYSIFIYTDSSKWVKSLGGEIATDAFAASEKSVASNMHNSKVPQNKINQVKAMKQITFRIKANRDDSGVDADRDIIIKCCKYGRFRVGEFMILEASDGSFLQACSNNRSGILDYIEARTPGNPGGGYRVESCTQEQIKDAFLRFYNQDESWKTFMLWKKFKDPSS